MSGAGLGFLPLEKIPIFIWGLILLAIGGFLFFQEDYFSWGQAKSGFIALAGICAIIYDIRKRYLKAGTEAGEQDD